MQRRSYHHSIRYILKHTRRARLRTIDFNAECLLCYCLGLKRMPSEQATVKLEATHFGEAIFLCDDHIGDVVEAVENNNVLIL
jgi:hypothetical protein